MNSISMGHAYCRTSPLQSPFQTLKSSCRQILILTNSCTVSSCYFLRRNLYTILGYLGHDINCVVILKTHVMRQIEVCSCWDRAQDDRLIDLQQLAIIYFPLLCHLIPSNIHLFKARSFEALSNKNHLISGVSFPMERGFQLNLLFLSSGWHGCTLSHSQTLRPTVVHFPFIAHHLIRCATT